MDDSDPKEPDLPNKRLGLRSAVTAVGLVLAAIHASNPSITIDTVTIILLIFAMLPWLQPLFKSVELLGVKFELQELRDTVKQQTKNLQLIEESATLPGRAGANQEPPERKATELTRPQVDEGSWDDDPNKGKFGGLSKKDGRILTAEITPAIDERSAACEVVLSVHSTDAARPLSGEVTFYLHPSFGRWKKYAVKVRGGIAKDEITSWGAFTVGAVADDGKTMLELDLTSVKGGTRKFYRT
jgi:hypothetical protein